MEVEVGCLCRNESSFLWRAQLVATVAAAAVAAAAVAAAAVAAVASPEGGSKPILQSSTLHHQTLDAPLCLGCWA